MFGCERRERRGLYARPPTYYVRLVTDVNEGNDGSLVRAHAVGEGAVGMGVAPYAGEAGRPIRADGT